MGGFLYFIPGASGRQVGLEELGELGLGYAFDSARLTRCDCVSGPKGAQGITVSGSVPDHDVGYHADRQEWRRIPGSENWVGYYRDAVPGPADLARAKPLPGHVVTLADGHDWLVPVARGWDSASAWGEGHGYIGLPQSIEYGDDGAWARGGVVEQHKALWELALSFWDELSDAMTREAGEVEDEAEAAVISFGFDQELDGAVAALGANYVVGPAECAMLGLFEDGHATEILLALVDWPVYLAWLKKKRTGRVGGGRYLERVRWARGLRPGYGPSVADLAWLAEG